MWDAGADASLLPLSRTLAEAAAEPLRSQDGFPMLTYYRYAWDSPGLPEGVGDINHRSAPAASIPIPIPYPYAARIRKC